MWDGKNTNEFREDKLFSMISKNKIICDRNDERIIFPYWSKSDIFR